ncbi:MAG: hypothetical protein COB93_10195 [Sneathiella sp.]|nr:MAG: hypothetical protein COB93_10195 [Sneathiella sp.]
MILKKVKYAVAALSLSAFMAAPGVAATNYIVNGGFEDGVGMGNNSWGVYDAIPGWATTMGRGIEVQNGNNIGGATPYEGLRKVELDSHNRSGTGSSNDNTNSGMQQKLTLGAGTYEFSFAYLGRTNDENTNGIGYSLMNGILNDAVTGQRTDGWVVLSHLFTLDAITDIFVNFWAKGTEDTYGGYLDDVRISAVPLPAALPLYGAGLAVMGLIGWQRKRKAAAATV